MFTWVEKCETEFEKAIADVKAFFHSKDNHDEVSEQEAKTKMAAALQNVSGHLDPTATASQSDAAQELSSTPNTTNPNDSTEKLDTHSTTTGAQVGETVSPNEVKPTQA